MMWFFHASLGLLVLSFTSSTIKAQQEIGTELCSCAPNTYNFTLDFSLFCPPVNITVGDAVRATSCLVSPFGNPQVEDLIPVAVQSIDILELGQDLRVLVQENIEGDFENGDTFSYTSIVALPGNITGAVAIPRALQLNIVGVNANNEPIINVYIITFSNSCGSYPVLQEGQSAGWTRFNDLGPPNREFCPLAPESTPTPTELVVTGAPTTSPTVETTTAAPTKSPTPSPTFAPSAGATKLSPSDMPSMIPIQTTLSPTIGSASPSHSLSFSPTGFPSLSPVSDAPAIVTVAPTMSMSMEMSMDLSLSMTAMMMRDLPIYEESDFAVLSETEFGVDARTSTVRAKAAKSDKSAKSSKEERRRLGRPFSV